MPPVAVGVAAGVASYASGFVLTAGAAVLMGGAVAVGLVALQKALTPDFPDTDVSPEQDQQVSTQPAQARKVIYGEAVVGAQLIGYTKENGEDGNPDYHHMVLHIAGHPCESAELFEIEGHSANEFGAGVFTEFKLGNHTTGSANAKAAVTGWTDAHVGYGQTYCYLRVEVDPDKMPSGLNSIKFKVKGKRVYDPRKDSTVGGEGTHRADDKTTWEWSDNPQLCAVDYARFHGAREQPIRRFDTDFIAAAANYCDELATYTDSSGTPQTEKRFTCNGVLRNTLKPGEGLKHVLSSFGGRLFRVGGKIYLKPAMYTGPATKTLDISQFNKKPQYRPFCPERERCNTVRAKFVSKEKKWVQTDAPVVFSQGYKDRDGAELNRALTLHMTNRGTEAQRLAKLELERTNAGFTVIGEMKGVHLDLCPGMVVQYTDADTGVDHEFEIQQVTFNPTKRTTQISLLEDAAAIYPDDFNAPDAELPPNSSLPTGMEILPSNLTFTPIYNGFYQVRLDWTNPYWATQVRIHHLREDDPVNNPGVTTKYEVMNEVLTDNSVFLQGLEPGNYTVDLRAIGRLNDTSEWVLGTALTINPQVYYTWKIYADDDVGTNPSLTDSTKPYAGYLYNQKKSEYTLEDIDVSLFGFFPNTASQWLFGTGVPQNTLGNVGDSYLEQTTGDVYKKTQSGWGSPVGNIGGSDGDKWLSGASDPAAGTGSDGDWYINTTTYELFQKVAGTWEPRGTIKGQDGSNAVMYFIHYPNGTAIKNGQGNVELQVYKLTGGTRTRLTGTAYPKLFDGTTDLTRTASLGEADINNSKVITLKNSGGDILDSVTVVDITDGQDGAPADQPVLPAVSTDNTLAWTKGPDGGAWAPSNSVSKVTYEFYQAGSVIAKRVISFSRASDGTITASNSTATGEATTFAFTNNNSKAVTAKVTHTASSVTASETVASSIGGSRGSDGDDAQLYYIHYPQGTQIKNGAGSIELQTMLVTGGAQSRQTSTGYPQLMDGTTALGKTKTFTANDINGSKTITLEESDGTILDSITLLDISDGDVGDDATYVSLDTTNGLTFVKGANGGGWEPTAASTDITWQFIKAGAVIATRTVRVTRDNAGKLTAVTQATSGESTTLTTTASGKTVMTLTVTHDASGASAPESVKSVIGGDKGNDGGRGAGVYYRNVEASNANDFTGTARQSWSPSEANAATPGSNVDGDSVTLYNNTAGYIETRQWSGSAWVAKDIIIDGNLIVNGAAIADQIFSRTLTVSESITATQGAVEAKMSAESTGKYAFSLKRDGVVVFGVGDGTDDILDGAGLKAGSVKADALSADVLTMIQNNLGQPAPAQGGLRDAGYTFKYTDANTELARIGAFKHGSKAITLRWTAYGQLEKFTNPGTVPISIRVQRSAAGANSWTTVDTHTFNAEVREITYTRPEDNSTYTKWEITVDKNYTISPTINPAAGDYDFRLFLVSCDSAITFTCQGMFTAQEEAAGMSLDWSAILNKPAPATRWPQANEISPTGDLVINGDVVSGKNSGGVALTINDGYGNANVTFNHRDGTPEQNGNAGRIEVNTDDANNAAFSFELKSAVTKNTTTALNEVFKLFEDSSQLIGDTGLMIRTRSNGGGAQLRFSDHGAISQYGWIQYYHADNAVISGTTDGFVFGGSEGNTVFRFDGKVYVDGSNEVFHTGRKPGWSDISGKPTTFTPSAHSHDEIASLGNQNVPTGRSVLGAGVHTYNTIHINTGQPEGQYGSSLVWGDGQNGSVEIWGGWTSGEWGELWVRALRNTIDNWTGWYRIYTDKLGVPWNDLSGVPSRVSELGNGTIYSAVTIKHGQTNALGLDKDNATQYCGLEFRSAGKNASLLYTANDGTNDLILQTRNWQTDGGYKATAWRVYNDNARVKFYHGISIDAGSWNQHALRLEGVAPSMYFNDESAGASNAFVGINGGNFYVLADADGNGSFESPYPMYLELDTGHMHLGGDANADNFKFTNGDVATRFRNNISVTTLNKNDTLPAGFYNTNSGATLGLLNDWYHVLHMHHDHNNGHDAQFAVQYDTAPDVRVRSSNGGTAYGAWGKVWTEFSDGAGSGLDADKLDGYHGDDYMRINVDGSGFPGMYPQGVDNKWVRTTKNGLLPEKSASPTAQLGISTWRFAEAHVTRVFSYGNSVFINSDNDYTPALFVQKKGDIANAGAALLVAGDGESTDVLFECRANASGPNTDTVGRASNANSADMKVQIYGNGDAYYAGLVDVAELRGRSDRRLKRNLVEIHSALNSVTQLTGYTYYQTELNQQQAGIVAQDLQTVLPEAVSESRDGTLSVNPLGAIGLLVNALKELNEKVERLERQHG